MRKYTNNSPETGARVVALALMADGAIDRSEILLLERHHRTIRPAPLPAIGSADPSRLDRQ